MDNDSSLQINFLNRIKDIIPASQSLAEELADVLKISTDSVYRRLRGETLLTINEVACLCNHYKISFDSCTERMANIPFRYDWMGNAEGFRNYLQSILCDMQQIRKAQNKQIIYAAIDIPIFHHFKFPELSAFKMFYWMKAVINVTDLADKKFSVSVVNPEFAELGKQIYETYSHIPSVEIWTDETINSHIKQIEFYWDSGNFSSKDDALTICNQVKQEIEGIQKQAETGLKIPDGTEDNAFVLYHSDIEIGNNCILTQKGDIEAVYLSIHTFNKLITSNLVFVNDTKIWLDNLIRKSSMISGISQKDRYQFFKKALIKVDALFEKISKES